MLLLWSFTAHISHINNTNAKGVFKYCVRKLFATLRSFLALPNPVIIWPDNKDFLNCLKPPILFRILQLSAHRKWCTIVMGRNGLFLFKVSSYTSKHCFRKVGSYLENTKERQFRKSLKFSNRFKIRPCKDGLFLLYHEKTVLNFSYEVLLITVSF